MWAELLYAYFFFKKHPWLRPPRLRDKNNRKNNNNNNNDNNDNDNDNDNNNDNIIKKMVKMSVKEGNGYGIS